MVSPASISTGTYGSSGATTIADSTTSAVTAGNKVLAFVFWFGAANLSSVSGGSLTWTVDKQNTGTNHRIAIASADAPSGLASGTAITATFSTFADARGLHTAQVDGLATNASGAIDGTGGANTSAATLNWSVSLTTSNADDAIFGASWVDFYTAGLSAASPATEIFDWTTVDGSESHAVYKVVSATGAQTIGGTFSGSRTNGAVAVAYKLAATVNTGTLSASLPRITGTVPDQGYVAGTLSASLPRVTASISGTSTNPAATSTSVTTPGGWWNALDAAAAGTGHARYVVVGDSYVDGIAATSRANTFTAKLAGKVRTAHAIAGSGLGLLNYDDATSHTGTVTADDSQTQASGAHMTGSASVTWTITGAAFDVMYRETPGAAAITVKVDGTTVGTIAHPGSGSNVPSKAWSYTIGTGGSHTVQVVTTDGQYIDGIVPYNGDTASVGLSFIKCGRSGTKTEYWLTTNPNARLGWAQFAPDLVIVEPTINDVWNDVPLATSAQNVADLCTYARGLSSAPTVLYIAPFYTNYATFFDDGTSAVNGLGLKLNDYRSAALAAAAAAGAMTLDMRVAIPDPVGSGYLENGHPNDAGHDAYAAAISAFLDANEITTTTSATLPRLRGSIAESTGNSGTLAASLPRLTGSASGTSTNPGSVAASLPRLTATLAGTATNSGTLAGSLPAITGSITGVILTSISGTLSASLPVVTGSVAGTARNPGTVSGTLPKLVGSFTTIEALVTFTPPTVRQTIDGDRLFGRYGTQVGQSVVKRDGVFTLTPFPWLGELVDLEEGVDYFLGGRVYRISGAIASALTGDGFTINSSLGYGAGAFDSEGYGA